MVTPVSGGVRVPTGADPALQIQAQGFNSLANRLSQFAATANKMAAADAEAKGLAYGARNAPTAAEVAMAMETGKPIDLPGDPSSFNVFQQAAYKGSLAVTEDRMDIAGRRYLTQMFAEAAANPEMDPSTLTAKLDSAVSEFASSLSAISPQSGAKVGKSLGMLANSQVVQFTREYMARETKRIKTDSLAAASEQISQSTNVVSGYQIEDGAATLEQRINTGRVRLESTLINGGVDAQTRFKFEQKYDQRVREAQINQIRDWAQNTPAYADDPLKAFVDLRKYASGKKDHGVPPRLQEMWKRMSSDDRVKAQDAVMQIIDQSNKAAELKRDQDALAGERLFDDLQRQVPDLIDANDREALNGVVKQFRLLGKFTQANDLQSLLDSNQTTLRSDEQALTRLNNLRAAGILNFGDVAKARLTEADKRKYVSDIKSQRDENITKALRTAQAQLLVDDDDIGKSVSMLSDFKKMQRIKFDRVRDKVYEERVKFETRIKEKLRAGTPLTEADFFDPQQIADEALREIQERDQAAEIKRLRDIVTKSFDEIASKQQTEGSAQKLVVVAPVQSRAFFLQYENLRGSIGRKAKQALRAMKLLEQLESQ